MGCGMRSTKSESCSGISFRLLECIYCGSKQSQTDKVILRAKRIINRIENLLFGIVNFKLFGLTCFTYLIIVHIKCQNFNTMHSFDFISNILLSGWIDKAFPTPVFDFNKVIIHESKQY